MTRTHTSRPKKLTLKVTSNVTLKTIFVLGLGIAWLYVFYELAHENLWFLLGTALGACLIVGIIWSIKFIKADPAKKDIRRLYIIMALMGLMIVGLILDDRIGISAVIVATLSWGALSSLLFGVARYINQT